MKFIDDNGIKFTNVLKAGINTSSGPIAIKNDYLDDEENPGYINKYKSNNKCLYVVNAIDIDWNGAQVDKDTTINTTGELISWISSKGSDDCPECVVTKDRFVLKTTGDLSGNNILLLCVNDSEETPIFQIGGANSKIQKSMLSDEIKGLLDGNSTGTFTTLLTIINDPAQIKANTTIESTGFKVTGKDENYVLLADGGTKLLSEIGGGNPGEPVGNLTFNTSDFSISETNKVSLSDNIVRTTGDLEIEGEKVFNTIKLKNKSNDEVILADGSTKPLSEFGVVKGINKIDFYKWEEVIIPSKVNKSFGVADRLSFRIIKNGVIVKDTVIDVQRVLNQETVYLNTINSLPFSSRLEDFVSENIIVSNIINSVDLEGHYVSESYVNVLDGSVINEGILLNYQLTNISSLNVKKFFSDNMSKINSVFKNNNENIFNNDDNIILTIPENRSLYVKNIPMKTFEELNVYLEILNNKYIYVARTIKKETEHSSIDTTFEYNNGMEEIIEALNTMTSGHVSDKMLSYFLYSDSGVEIAQAINSYISTGNGTSIANYIKNARALTMAIYELQYCLSHNELWIDYVNALEDEHNSVDSKYKNGNGYYLVLNEYDLKFDPIKINQAISEYYTNPDTLTKTIVPLESDINVTAKWSDLISNN